MLVSTHFLNNVHVSYLCFYTLKVQTYMQLYSCDCVCMHAYIYRVYQVSLAQKHKIRKKATLQMAMQIAFVAWHMAIGN